MDEKEKRYREQKANAKRRGIEFLLTFSEWWAIWEPHYEKRGRKKGMMVMCRNLDKGPYELGNVRIDYATSNSHEKIAAKVSNKGTSWGKSQRSIAGCGMHLPNCLMAGLEEQPEAEEDNPFDFYAELHY